MLKTYLIKVKNSFTGLIFLALVFCPSYAKAGGVIDDWLGSQTISSGPNYYEGQKRGYFTAGTFSARVGTKNDYLMSITPPKLNVGCGGIDMFMGGFSFLNADYLVEKGQKLIQAAPYVAFNIALEELAPQVSNAMKSAEDIINKLNSLQLDECAMAKDIVATVKDVTKGTKNLTDSVSNWKISEGVSDVYKSVTKAIEKDNGVAKDVKPSDLIADCPAIIKDIFAKPGTLLFDNIGNKMGVSADYIALIRGYIGDVYVNEFWTKSTRYTAEIIDACNENEGAKAADMFSTGNVWVKPTANVLYNTCVKATDINKDLTNYIYKQLVAVAKKMEDKNANITDEQLNFIKNSPLPISRFLKVAITTHDVEYVASLAAEPIGKAYAIKIMDEILAKSNFIFNKVEQIEGKNSSAVEDGKPHKCVIEALEGIDKYPVLEKRAKELKGELKIGYKTALAEFASVQKMVEGMKDYDNEGRKKLAKQTGTTIQNRANKKGFDR